MSRLKRPFSEKKTEKTNISTKPNEEGKKVQNIFSWDRGEGDWGDEEREEYSLRGGKGEEEKTTLLMKRGT